MARAQARGDFEGDVSIAATGEGCCCAGQELVGDFGHRGDHDDGAEALLGASCNDGSGALDGGGIFDRRAAELHDDDVRVRRAHAGTAPAISDCCEGHLRKSNLPRTARISALRMAAPAAPRMVLWESKTNFQSKMVQGRRRPMVVAMPLPRMRSRRGCGRASSGAYSTGKSGAEGRCSPWWPLPLSGWKFSQAATISSYVARVLSLMLMHSVWPSMT